MDNGNLDRFKNIDHTDMNQGDNNIRVPATNSIDWIRRRAINDALRTYLNREPNEQDHIYVNAIKYGDGVEALHYATGVMGVLTRKKDGKYFFTTFAEMVKQQQASMNC